MASEFWSHLDDALIRIHLDTEAYVLGPQELGRWCCNTCSNHELYTQADDDDVKEPVIIYYHDQNRDGEPDECHLGWAGGQRALDLVKQMCEYYGLVVELPKDEREKILVKYE